MKNRRSLVSAGAILVVFAGTACAASVTYGGGLASPGTYFGTGNSNTDWTVDTSTDGTLELGLGALIRYVTPVAPVAPLSTEDADYYVPTGATTYPSKTGSAWGYDFSVNTDANGMSSATLSSYTYELTITDETTLATGSYDPSPAGLFITDDSTNGSTGFQNAEALSFGFPAIGYDINATDTYQITLTATPTGVGSAESVSIDVIATTPEPQTWFLIGTGLLCVMAARRRSLQQRA